MHPEDIKSKIRKSGVTLQGLALQNGLSPTACIRALRHPFKRAVDVISSHIGIPPHKIWPGVYDEKGKRIRKTYTHKNRLKKDKNNRKNLSCHDKKILKEKKSHNYNKETHL